MAFCCCCIMKSLSWRKPGRTRFRSSSRSLRSFSHSSNLPCACKYYPSSVRGTACGVLIVNDRKGVLALRPQPYYGRKGQVLLRPQPKLSAIRELRPKGTISAKRDLTVNCQKALR